MIDSVSNNGADGADLKRTRRKRSETHAVNSIDRLPPHAPESEQAIIGCVLYYPDTAAAAVDECIDAFGDRQEEVFYDLRHQTIYKALIELREKNVKIDTITLMEHLKTQQLLEQIGGIGYLAALPESAPSVSNLSYYLDIVKEKFVLRKMIHTFTDGVGRIYDYEGEYEELIDEVERDVLSIRNFSKSTKVPTMKDSVRKAIETIEDFHNRKGAILGLTTGFSDLDKMTAGLCPGDVFIISGRPSLGKTSLAMNIAEHVAVDCGLPVGVFSLEMTRDSLVLRMLCSRARVNFRNVRDGFLAERDFPKLTGTAGKLSTAPIFVEDASGLTIMQLRAKARRMHQQEKVKLFIIDYLQLLKAMIGKKRIENRQQEISEISGGIKALAKELNVPVIVLSQLNRDLDKQKRKPVLADLRESGAIEQDGDIVGMLYKPIDEDDERVADCVEAVPTNLIIAKQRNGPTGEVNLVFLKSYTRFESAAKVSDDDVPDAATQTRSMFPDT